MGRSFEDKIAAVHAAVADPSDAKSRALLVKTMAGKQGYLVSLAAAALGGGNETLRQEATLAFARLLEDPIKRDPQCHGKVAIARAFFDADVDAESVFLAGVGHVQLEPVLGGRQDTAAELRGVCLMALVHNQHHRAFVHAAAMLADAERAARLAAIRALESSGRPELAEPLLRLWLETGDRDPEVVTEGLTTLLRLDPKEYLAFAARCFAGKDDAAAESAALAVGASRCDGAIGLLCDASADAVTPTRRRTISLAIAMLRSDAAWQHLIEQVLDGGPGEASDALDALATFREHPGLRERVEAAVADRADPALHSQFSAAFEPS